MIDPPVTNSPENTLMPSRCEFESRPFFELPNPFLCAITNTFQQPPTALGHNFLHFHTREILTVTDSALVLLFALEFKNKNFVAAPMCCNSGAHASIL